MYQMMERILAFANMNLAWAEVQDGGQTPGVDHWTTAVSSASGRATCAI